MSTALRIDRLEKNYVINGGMHFFQRAISGFLSLTTPASVSYKVADKFGTYANRVTNNQGYTTTQSTDVPTEAGFVYPYSLKVTSNFIHSFTGEDRVEPIYQYIEGNTLSEIGNSDTINIRFWFKASTSGTYVFHVNLSTDGSTLSNSYVSTFSYVTGSTWQLVTSSITLPGVSLHRGSGIGMHIGMGDLSGSSSAYQTSTLNTWQSGAFLCNNSATNWASSTSGFIQMTGLSITKAAVSSYPMAGKDFAGELRMCQRYYEFGKFVSEYDGAVSSTFRFGGWLAFKSTKRATPTVTATDAGGAQVSTAPAEVMGIITVDGTALTGIGSSSASSVGRYLNINWTADADL